METLKETPPTLLRVERIRQGIKPWKLSEYLGISLSLYYLYEQGRKWVAADMRHRIAAAMNVSVDTIFEDEQDA